MKFIKSQFKDAEINIQGCKISTIYLIYASIFLGKRVKFYNFSFVLDAIKILDYFENLGIIETNREVENQILIIESKIDKLKEMDNIVKLNEMKLVELVLGLFQHYYY